MTDTVRILGQSIPAGGTLTDLYTVPATTSALVNLVAVCNQSSQPTTYRLSVAVGGVSDSVEQYLVFDAPLLGNETHMVPVTPIPIKDSDVVRGTSGNGMVSFTLGGLEIT